MAEARQLPCNGDGMCMLCKTTPSETEALMCITCATPWHASCLAVPPETLASVLEWECPDCTITASGALNSGSVVENPELVAAILAIEADPSLTEAQKAKRRQVLMSGHVADSKGKSKMKEEEEEERVDNKNALNILDIDENFRCAICLQPQEKPVTTPCGHNFCLKCFEKWMTQGKHICPKCRADIPSKMAKNPRINSVLVTAIREARMSKPVQPHRIYSHEDRPDTAFTTERAKRAGLANAASGRIFVTAPSDHFGPITAEHDPERNQGVLVGECWNSRMEVRQWGVHLAHVSGISGQSKNGAQSVVLSGGYQEDEDHGDWFLYTGSTQSGGRDLSGNKRTNKKHSSDQDFVKCNEALRVSCMKGYPVRVVRAYKNKLSPYSPPEGYRYDGIYRVERCWRKIGPQGYIVCQYLFIRCDNEPAPWRSDEHGDRPESLPFINELYQAIDICRRIESPSWDFDEEDGCWKWKKAPPHNKATAASGGTKNRKRGRRDNLILEKLSCVLCREMLKQPLTTPCGHSFCKACLESNFAGQSSLKDRSGGGRMLRTQRNAFTCPAPQCQDDISDFLQNPQVNTELADLIGKLQPQRAMNVETADLSYGEELEEGNTRSGSDAEGVA